MVREMGLYLDLTMDLTMDLWMLTVIEMGKD